MLEKNASNNYIILQWNRHYVFTQLKLNHYKDTFIIADLLFSDKNMFINVYRIDMINSWHVQLILYIYKIYTDILTQKAYLKPKKLEQFVKKKKKTENGEKIVRKYMTGIIDPGIDTKRNDESHYYNYPAIQMHMEL